MNLDLGHIVGTLVSSALVLFFIYRRFRRNFGKQRLRRGYLIFRMVLLCVVGALLVLSSLFSTEMALVTLVGAGIGVGLAIWAAKHTRFLNQDGVLYYIPHTYTGMVVSALFLGRLIYRFVVLSQSKFTVAATDTTLGPGDFGGMGTIYHNPVTRLVFFILIGYYVYYYWFVLHESKHLKPEDMEDGTPVAAKAKPGPGGNI